MKVVKQHSEVVYRLELTGAEYDFITNAVAVEVQNLELVHGHDSLGYDILNNLREVR